jgi:hypothetical protein
VLELPNHISAVQREATSKAALKNSICAGSSQDWPIKEQIVPELRGPPKLSGFSPRNQRWLWTDNGH